MSAAAPTASTTLPDVPPRRRRPLGALIAVALLVGFIANTGASTYLGPYAVTVTYFTVTGPADPQSGYSGPVEWTVQASTRAEAISALRGQPYLSLVGPAVSTYPEPRSWDPSGDALRVGLLAALLAFVALYLLGLTARFRPIEARLGGAGAAFGRALGSTKRRKAGSLLLVVAGAIASGLTAVALIWAFTATATSLGWLDWTDWTAMRMADVAGLVLLLAIASWGILAAIAIVVRRAHVSRGVGAFLVGYGGLLAALWVQGLTNIWASCDGSDLSLTGNGATPRVACFVAEFSRQWFPLGVVALFATILVVGSILVYREYQRGHATPSDQPSTPAIA
jgi:hypothetical protein